MLWYNLQISGYTCVSVDGFFFASFHIMFRGCLINQCAIRKNEENLNIIPTCKAGFQLCCFDDFLHVHASWLYGV